MKTNLLKWSLIILAPAAMLALAACSSTSTPPPGETSTSTAFQPGVPGGVRVETRSLIANVTAIDAASRKVTLLTSDGKKTTVTCGPQVINFDQIRVGDQLKVKVTEEVVVYLADAAAPSKDGGAGLVALAPKGAQPGGLFANTAQVTAKVIAIDLRGHRATLLFPDGTTKQVAVRPDVDLTKRRVGEEVVIRITEVMAVNVTKK